MSLDYVAPALTRHMWAQGDHTSSTLSPSDTRDAGAEPYVRPARMLPLGIWLYCG